MKTRYTTDGRTTLCGLFVLALLLGPARSNLWAQGISGSIAGVVRDTSGAVLPGVTVQASSPALIEKSRETTTDEEGRYRITDLRPGVYAVQFALSGFNTTRREGIQLSANFNATINGEMRVGSFEETLTVTGQPPTVDVQNVVQQATVSREVLDTVPMAKTFINISSLAPSVNIGGQAVQDMGNGGDRSGTMQAHGSRLSESQIDLDGMPIHNGLARGGGQFGHYVNDGSTQEMVIEVGGMNAEHEIGGVRANVIPKEGGNTLRGSFFTSYSGSHLQSNNLDQDLMDQGLTSVNHNNKIWDFSPNVGGRIIQDRLWFYGAFRHWGLDNNVANLYANATPTSFFYTPDYTKPGRDLSWHVSGNTRFTMQPTQRNKINLFYEFQYSCFCYGYNPSSTVAPEAQISAKHKPQYLIQSTWNRPHTNSLLFEAGFTLMANDPHRHPQPELTPDLTGIVDSSKAFTYRSAPGGYGFQRSDNYNGRASASYVTGSHSFKTGMFWMYQWNYVTTEVLSDMSFTFNGTSPTGLTQWAGPLAFRERVRNIGLYAQDQWTIDRVTLNYGLRFDHIHGWVPEQHLAAGRFVDERNFAKVDNVPLYNDISPRLGASWDVFGDGKTAVKASIGRYLVGIGSQNPIGRTANPVQGAVNSTNRSWTDFDNDYVPDCDLRNLQVNLECGRVNNLNFGNQNTATTTFDPGAVTGWGNRGYNWEGAVSFQRELSAGMSASVSYSRRWYGNFFVTENTAVSAADFDPYCITAPLNANLPGGGGNRICGFYDVSQAKFGQNISIIRLDEGKMQDVYDGIDLTLSARMSGGITLFGGTSTGRERTNVCAYLNMPNFAPGLLVNGAPNTTAGFVGSAGTISSPHDQAFCNIEPPFQTNLKFVGVYPLPWWGLSASATYQNLPGVALNPSYQASSASIAPSLGRPLSAGANANVLLDLYPTNTLFSDRISQTNLRFEKSFRTDRGRIKGIFELFNMFNQNPVLQYNTRVNASYPLPTLIQPARMIKFGAQWDF